MKLKFLKYWENIPLLYSFAFILDSRTKLRGLFNVLQILKENIGIDYSSYYANVKTEIYKLFTKYDRKFGVARTQRPAHPASHTCKKKTGTGKNIWRPWIIWCCWFFPYLYPHFISICFCCWL
jgi:hypothetical protein